MNYIEEPIIYACITISIHFAKEINISMSFVLKINCFLKCFITILIQTVGHMSNFLVGTLINFNCNIIARQSLEVCTSVSVILFCIK